jgi:hypothetical protein
MRNHKKKNKEQMKRDNERGGEFKKELNKEYMKRRSDRKREIKNIRKK